MKLAFVLALAMVLVAVLLPEESEAMPRNRRFGRARRPPGARRFSVRRGGRTFDYSDPAEDGAGGEEGGEEGEQVPEWCDPAQPMGAWLNFANVRAECTELGFTDFGGYGGAPAEGEEEEAA